MFNFQINDIGSNTSSVFSAVEWKIFDEISSVAIFYFNIKTKEIVYISDSAVSILGYDPQIFFDGGIDFLNSIIHEKDYALLRNKYFDLIHNKKYREHKYCNYNSKTLEVRIKNSNKSWLWIDINLVLIDNLHKKKQLFGVIKKITNKGSNNENGITKDRQSVDEKEEYCNSITDREKEVLSLIADGLSAKKLADKLYISVHTAINHRKNLIAKLRVKNTAELISVTSKYFVF